MNYEEAISELNHELSVGNIGVITRDNIAKALTYAQKEHELLGLYRECNKEGVFWLEIQQRIAQLEKELEELE